MVPLKFHPEWFTGLSYGKTDANTAEPPTGSDFTFSAQVIIRAENGVFKCLSHLTLLGGWSKTNGELPRTQVGGVCVQYLQAILQRSLQFCWISQSNVDSGWIYSPVWLIFKLNTSQNRPFNAKLSTNNSEVLELHETTYFVCPFEQKYALNNFFVRCISVLPLCFVSTEALISFPWRRWGGCRFRRGFRSVMVPPPPILR